MLQNLEGVIEKLLEVVDGGPLTPALSRGEREQMTSNIVTYTDEEGCDGNRLLV